MGMTFKVTYRRDLLNYITDLTNPLLKPYGTPAKPVSNGDGTETITYNLQTNAGPITTLTPIVTIHFQVMVAKDYNSTIAASNAVFWGTDPKDTLCYVINADTSAIFNPDPNCGDSSLRHFLYGYSPTRIIGVTPNPSIEGQVPMVTYEVKQAKVPLTIELYNALGERIRLMEKDVPHEIGEYNMPFGVKNLPSGMYILRITSPTSVESSSFVIQK